jgi:hypothetical protein
MKVIFVFLLVVVTFTFQVAGVNDAKEDSILTKKDDTPKLNSLIEAVVSDFESLASSLDVLAVQSDSQEIHEASFRESFAKFEEMIKNLGLSVEESIIKKFGQLVEMLKERREHNRDERIKEWEEFKHELREFIHSTTEKINQAEEGVLKSIKNLRLRKEQRDSKEFRFLAGFNKLKTSILTKLTNVKKNFERLFKRVEKHGGIAHHPHEKMIQCGGKTYSLQEFLDIFDSEHNLLIIEENFWTDHDLEEFYEGWDVWAKRMGLKCEGGASDWHEITVPKDEL